MRVAAIQMNSRDNWAENLGAAADELDRAAATGADIVALPELWTFLGRDEEYPDIAPRVHPDALALLQRKAREHGVVIHGGSMVEPPDDGGNRCYNTTYVIDRDGSVLGRYRKIHLFDARLADGNVHRESDGFAPGHSMTRVAAAGAMLGLSICYDLRFPELFRSLAAAGANVLMVPSAFAFHTGRDHWESLLRARAIENSCFVVAPAQVGVHPPAKRCYGRSMIVDPWGIIITQSAIDAPTIVATDLDLNRVVEVRQQLATLEHRRPDVYATAPS